MKRIVVLVSCVVAALAVVLPASANHKPTTGTQIDIFHMPLPTTFAANTPFYIEHGWGCGGGPGFSGCKDEVYVGESGYSVGDWMGHSDFQLYLDDELQPSTIDVDVVPPSKGNVGSIFKFWLTNYPAGLPTGTYTFHGVWTGPTGTVDFETYATITFS
jgi:hypothetical protein